MPMPQAKKNPSGLGRAIINRRAREQKKELEQLLHTTELPSGLSSVTQETSLDEFLNSAQLAETDFTAERTKSISIASPNPTSRNPFLLTPEQDAQVRREHDENRSSLRVPRRPKWTRQTSKEELERNERTSFLEWRRGLARLQDGPLLLTPFERNLEVWRQLWRTIERSHLVVQIVDARNPLAFRCEDLEEYVQQVEQPLPRHRIKHDEEDEKSKDEEDSENNNDLKRENLLLINKADLLTPEQRKIWADYFNDRGVRFAFFSARDSAALLENEQDEEEDEGEESVEREGEGEEESKQEEGIEGQAERVLSVDELEELFLSCAPRLNNNRQEYLTTVGLVGYPNVGKSSTINALMGAKKVSVSSTPGKTKHFQTMRLSSSVELCDCPGLVFPQFATTQAELVCDGVLPIDQMKEYTAPVQLVVSRVGKEMLEEMYGIKLDGKIREDKGILTAYGALAAYAASRGFYTQGQGIPDGSRASRYILKDYVNAKLLYCHSPPGIDGEKFNQDARLQLLERVRERRQGKKVNYAAIAAEKKTAPKSFDEENEEIFSNNLDPVPSKSGNKKHFKGHKKRTKKQGGGGQGGVIMKSAM